jgi:uncharacterized protein
MRRWLASLAALLALVALSVSSVPALAAGAPAPTVDASRGPDGLLRVPPLARVSDPASLLSAGDRSALEAKLAAFEAKQGSQIAILLVPSTKPEPIEDFAHRVGDAWKIGRKGIGDGLLIVVAVQDRTARIDVARSLEGAIPDIVAGRIVRANMAPHFVNKDYAGGLNEALDVLFARIGGEGLAPGSGVNTGPQTARDLAPGSDADATIHSLLPFLIGGVLIGSLLRRLLGVLGAVLAAGGALALVSYLFSSLLLGGVAGVVVFVLALFGAPMMLAQVLGGRAGGGFGGGGGGFRSGGGGDFSGGGASGNW